MSDKNTKNKVVSFVLPMSVGEKLRHARLKKKMTILEAESKTLIRAKYIKAFEESKFYELPLPIYTYGFLQTYAQYLGLGSKKVLEQFKEEYGLANMASVKNFSPESKLKQSSMIITPKILWGFLLGALSIAVIGYIATQVMGFASAPILIVDTPTQQSEVVGDNLNVSGTTDSGATVTIGQQKVLVDEQGQFNESVRVDAGVNTISIKSTGRSGRSRTIVRTVTVKEPHTAYSAGEGNNEQN